MAGGQVVAGHGITTGRIVRPSTTSAGEGLAARNSANRRRAGGMRWVVRAPPRLGASRMWQGARAPRGNKSSLSF